MEIGFNNSTDNIKNYFLKSLIFGAQEIRICDHHRGLGSETREEGLKIIIHRTEKDCANSSKKS